MNKISGSLDRSVAFKIIRLFRVLGRARPRRIEQMFCSPTIRWSGGRAGDVWRHNEWLQFGKTNLGYLVLLHLVWHGGRPIAKY